MAGSAETRKSLSIRVPAPANPPFGTSVNQVVTDHITETCTAERWVGFALTLAHVLPVLELGLPDVDRKLEALRLVATRTLGDAGLPWYVSYRVRVAVK